MQPIHGVAPATEYDRRRRPRIWHACAAPLMRFRLLQHCPAAESTALRFRAAPGFTSPGPFRPQGFAPSRRFPPRTACPALFRAGALLEFLPLQSFSLVRSRNASRRSLCLPAVGCDSQQPDEPPSGLASPMWSGRRTRWPSTRLQGFAPRYESVAHPPAVKPTACPMLSWGSVPFRVFSLEPAPACFHTSSSRELPGGVASEQQPKPPHRSALRRHPGSPECSQARKWPRQARRGSPHGVLPPRRRPPSVGAALSWLMVSPRVQDDVTSVSAVPLRTWLVSRPELGRPAWR